MITILNFAFGGVDLTPYLKFEKLTEQIGNKRTLSTVTNSGIGESLTSVDIGPKTFKIKVSMASRPIGAVGFVDPSEAPIVHTATLQETKERVASILHATEPKELYLPNKPGRYYMALPTGDIELTGVTDWYDTATIEFYVPSGVALDINETVHEVQFTDRADMKMLIDYEGTAPAYPVIEYTQESENAYVGVSNGKQSWVMGDITESDTGSYTQNEFLLNARPWKNILTDAVTTSGAKVPASLTSSIRPQTYNHYIPETRETGTFTGKDNLSGIATWEYTLPADSNGDNSGVLNLYTYWRQWFETASLTQKSWMEITFRDADNNILFGARTIKNRNDNLSSYECFVYSSKTQFRSCFVGSFQANNRPENNPFMAANGHCDIERLNDNVRFYFGGAYRTYTEPYLKGKKVKKVAMYVRNLDGAEHVTRCYFGSLLVQKLSVTKTYDETNRYIPGAVIVSDGVERDYTYNRQSKLGDMAAGSEFIELTPGNNTITFQNSSWSSTAGKATVRYRARYL